MITLANIRKAIYCLNKRLDLLEGGEYSNTVTELSNKVHALESLLDDDAQNPTTAIDKFNEIVTFLDSIDNTETLQELLRDVVQQSYQQNYVTVLTYANLPTTGSADTIYRVSNYNGSTNQIDTTSYSEYVWDNSDYTLLCVKSQIGEVFDISEYHGGQTYLNLEAALDSNNGGGVPQPLQKGGMSVKFVRSSDNKYVQYFLTKDEWSASVDDWEKMNLEEEYANVKKNDLLTCLALTQAQIDSLAKIPRCVKGLGVSPTFTPSGQLYWKYAGKRKGRETAFFQVVDGNGTTIDIFNTDGVIDISAKYGLRLFEGTSHRFWFLVDLRDLYQYDDYTGNGNFYDYGQTLPIDFASVQVTDLSKILANNASISALSTLPAVVANKVDKVEGKGLSTNDYTDSDKEAVSQFFGATTSRSYVKTTGRLSEFIPAEAGKRYKISFTSDNSTWDSCLFTAYDDSESLNVKTTIASGSSNYLDTPAGTTRILVYCGTTITGLGITINVSVTLETDGVLDSLEESISDINTRISPLEKSSLVGKKIMCFGDSITEFNTAGKGWVEHASELGGDFIRGACGGSRYVPRATATDTPSTNAEAKGNFDIANLVDAWVNNHWTGVDASVEYLQGQHAVSVANLKANPVSNVDMVVLMGGTNDFSSNVQIGEVTDVNTATILGAIKHCVQVILTANPKIKIYILSPLVRYFGEDSTTRTEANWCDNYANNTGKTTADMVDAQGDVAKYMHTPFCNLYYELGWNQYNFSEYFRDDDNTHPHKGFKVLAERIHSWLTAKI